MIIYSVDRSEEEASKYLRDGVPIEDVDRIPPIVIERLEESDSFRYDDKPDEPRCMFCEGPAAHTRLVNQEMVPLCDSHYHSKNTGTIFAELRRLEALKPKPKIKRKRRMKKRRGSRREPSHPVPTQPQPQE